MRIGGSWSRDGVLACIGVTIGLMSAVVVPVTPVGASTIAQCSRVESRSQLGEVAASSAIVTFSSLLEANATFFDSIAITDPAGTLLDPGRCRVISPTSISASGKVAGPVFVVEGVSSFAISLSGAAIETPESLRVTVLRSGETRSLHLEGIDSALAGAVSVGEAPGALSFTANAVPTSALIQTREIRDASFRIIAQEQRRELAPRIAVRMLSSGNRSAIRVEDPNPSTWVISAVSSNVNGRSSFHSRPVRVSARDQLVLSYPTWTGASGRPTLWLDRKSDGKLDTRIALLPGLVP